jgi:hypothetical protein
MLETATRREQRLEDAHVLVELGELSEAEAELATILEESADDFERCGCTR